ncbi:MAG: hypothetical protein QM650_18490 [Microlunatus sp.]
MTTDAARSQPAALQAVTRRRSDAVYQRATTALAKLRREGSEITFASVAREAQVSRRYLHSHDELAGQIRKLRPAAARQPLPEAADGESGIVSVLRAKILQQQTKISDLEGVIRSLKHDLEIAHGEIIMLRSGRRRPDPPS